MSSIPKEKSLESTFALLRTPYDFISSRCQRYGSDVFEARILFQKTICMTGKDAAELFYDPERFVRKKAAPEPVRATLFGKGGIQNLDGEKHRRRKELFMSMMTSERIDDLVNLTCEQLHFHLRNWETKSNLILYYELQKVLTAAVCSWVGMPVPNVELEDRTKKVTALFDAAGAKNLRHLWSRWARIRCEKWIMNIVDAVRDGRFVVSANSPVFIFSNYKDTDDKLLSSRIVAIEILNLIRPTVAVSLYMVFIAHALHLYPKSREKIISDENYIEYFVQEVRRFYPFFPAVIARVRKDFKWREYKFKQGTRVMLDLYGTNHDSRIWKSPEEFQPERFREWNKDPYGFIPQGGGDYYLHHRCPGEWITIELMKLAVNFFTRQISYDVPDQNLEINRSRLPAIPQSGFIISNVVRAQV